MVNWTAEKLKALGASIELADVGTQTLPDGRVLPLPKVILAKLGKVSKRCDQKLSVETRNDQSMCKNTKISCDYDNSLR